MLIMALARRLKPVQLMLVVKVFECQKLQDAAKVLGISQPAASRMLAEIEQLAGAELFQRHAYGMEPTDIGAAFYRHARASLGALANLENEIRQLSAGRAGEVRVGTVTGPAVGYVVPAIREVRDQAPDLEASIEVGPSSQLIRGLQEGRFHFILSRLPERNDWRDLLVTPARTETVALLVRRTHSLLGRTKVTLEQLSGYEWVVQEPGTPIRQAVEEAFRLSGAARPKRVTNSSSLLVALALIEGSDAIAPQSREVADMLTQGALGAGLATLTLEQTITVAPYYLIRNRSQYLPKAAERVFEAIRKQLQTSLNDVSIVDSAV